MNDTDSFLMDIRRKKKAGKNENNEYLLIHPGSDNQVRVESVDKNKKQAILAIQEPAREVINERQVYDDKARKVKTVRQSTVTDADLKRFLVGMDEMHLFMCQLPKGSGAKSITKAHKVLKPKSIGKKRSNYKRQGEWFFTPVKGSLANRLEALKKQTEEGKGSERDVRRQFGMRSGGTSRPHVAEWYISLNNDNYVKGDIVHPDHHTKTLNQWHKVEQNREETGQMFQGMTWFD
jgi:hypothetical protein